MPEEGVAGDEPDLAALIFRVVSHLMALEEPILQDAGLSMWEYVIVTELAAVEVVSQVELSRQTGRDPTRLGRHLDDLTARGLVVRARASDRRQRTVGLSDSGRVLYSKVKKRVRAAEDKFLHSALPAGEAADLRPVLTRLAAGSAPVGDP